MPLQAAARKDDQVSHTDAMPDMLIGVGLGVLAAVAIVVTGGTALPVILGAAAVVGGSGLAGELWGGAQDPHPCGPIVEGVPSIKIGPDAKEAAMATAHVHCDQHSDGTLDATASDVLLGVMSPLALAYSALTHGSGPQIAEGSATVFFSSQRLMAARTGDKGTCGFVISEGCRTVIIGGPTGTAKGLSAGGEVPAVINYGLMAMTLAPAVFEVAAAGSVAAGALALGRIGLGFAGSWVGADVLGRVGERYGGKKGKAVGQLVGGLVGGLGASKGAGKLLPERLAGPLDGAARQGWKAVKGMFGGGSEAGGGAGVEAGPDAGGGASGGGTSGAGEPTFQPHTPESLARGQAAADAWREGIRRGDDLPGRGPWGPAQALVDALLGRARLALAAAGEGGAGAGERSVFDEGGGVFSKKGDVMQMAADDAADGGAGSKESGVESGSGSGSNGSGGNASKPIPTDLVPNSTSKQTISLRGDWRKTTFPNNDKGIIYLLKDADTGEVLKVGKTVTDPDTFEGRLDPYARAGRYTGRNLEMELHTVPKPDGSSLESVEASVREKLVADGHTLPWDNSGVRLGRPGPGVPNAPVPRRLRVQGVRWQGEKLVNKNGVELSNNSNANTTNGSIFDDGGGVFAPKSGPSP